MKAGRYGLGLMAAGLAMAVGIAANPTRELIYPGDLLNEAPPPRKNKPKTRKLFRPWRRSEVYTGYGSREVGRFAGWPAGPLNNRAAGSHIPRTGQDGGFVNVGGVAVHTPLRRPKRTRKVAA